MWAPSHRPPIICAKKALWCSGPGLTITESGSRRNTNLSWPQMAGCGSTISLGRPVLPPLVAIFHGLEILIGKGSSE